MGWWKVAPAQALSLPAVLLRAFVLGTVAAGCSYRPRRKKQETLVGWDIKSLTQLKYAAATMIGQERPG